LLLESFLDTTALLDDLLRPFLVVPKIGLRYLRFELF
jgi:hypothetical protein